MLTLFLGFGLGILRWYLLWYEISDILKRSELIISETINGLGMHLLAVTPSQLVAMTKVKPYPTLFAISDLF